MPLLLILYAVYILLVGVHGNSQALLKQIQTEKQFLYWIVAVGIVAALYETDIGSRVARPMAVLIVLGFLLHNNNWRTIATNAKQVLPAL